MQTEEIPARIPIIYEDVGFIPWCSKSLRGREVLISSISFLPQIETLGDLSSEFQTLVASYYTGKKVEEGGERTKKGKQKSWRVEINVYTREYFLPKIDMRSNFVLEYFRKILAV